VDSYKQMHDLTKTSGPIIQFKVEGFPPNQKSHPSIWSDLTQSLWVVDLRKKALESKNNANITGVLTSKIRLDLEIYASKEELDTMGDLDNLLGGVCDALSACPRNQTLKFAECFFYPDNADIDPTRPLLYNDDKIIRSLEGTKIEIVGEPYYTVKIFKL
jgi:hypothetical protein